MFGKIAIRNIPSAIFDGLVSLASRHERSTEAEARYALRAWVEPFLQENQRSNRRIKVSTRLREALDQVSKLLNGRLLEPSQIAEAIGEELAEPLENWFIGEKEPTFKQLDAIATYLGCSADWLKHGNRKMFPVETQRIPEDAKSGVSWLLDLDSNDRVTHLHLVRESDESGSLLLIKQYGEWRCKTYMTPYHVSEVIGAGGESSLAHLSVTLELLYKYWGKMGERLVVKSYLMPKESFGLICGGTEHPLAILREKGREELWWEDFWDLAQFPEHNYWEGWANICDRIHRVVQSKPHLQEELELIRSGKHPLLQKS